MPNGRQSLLGSAKAERRVGTGAHSSDDGRSGQVSFRLLHIFEFRDGKITRERALCDLAAIQRQLGCVVS